MNCNHADNRPEGKPLLDLKKCEACGSEFYCSASARCWCMEYQLTEEQRVSLEKKYKNCLCPECLKKWTGEKISV